MSTVHDMVVWWRNPNWQFSHLEGTTNTGSKCIQYCHDTGAALVYTKTTQFAAPWDVVRYDLLGLYDDATESSWTDFKQWKKNGWKMFPRLWDDANPGLVVHNPVAKVQQYMNCKPFGSPGSVAPTDYWLFAPTPYNFGGNIGTLMCIQSHYYWSKKNRERWWACREHGRVKWQYEVLVNGVWTIKQWSNHNNVVSGGITPNFPCGIVP